MRLAMLVVLQVLLMVSILMKPIMMKMKFVVHIMLVVLQAL